MKMPNKVVPLAAPVPAKRIRTKILYAREKLIDIITEMGPLMRAHDAEVWPGRKWGPRGVKFNVLKYLNLEAQGILKVITARTGSGRLIGYCLEALELDDHYGMRGSINCGFFLHRDFRVGKGLSLRKHPGYRLLLERERLLDEVKAERRRIGVKVWIDFGPLLKRLGYEPDMIQYVKMAVPEKDED